MRSARVVGLSPDGKYLIVATENGEELMIVADERLRAAVRGDRPRLGQLEIHMESALSPRDIQTRIRAGESLEAVGRIAGIPLDRVERFAAPVLAEREHIAAVAMSASVRRRGETSGHRSLRITVTERLLTRGVDIDTIDWDSYRLDDGHWAVTADYRSGEAARHATFTYDPRSRFSVAANDEARWLLGEHSSAKGPQPGRRRPTESATTEDDNEPTLDLSDELALVRATQEDPEEAAEPTPAVRPTSKHRRAAAAPSGGGPAPSARGRRVQRGLPAGLPRLSDGTAVPRTDLGPGWEPAIVVNYPVEPSQHLDSEPPVRPGEPSPEPDRPAEVPLSDEPPPEIDLPSVPDSRPTSSPNCPAPTSPARRTRRSASPIVWTRPRSSSTNPWPEPPPRPSPDRPGVSGPACRAGTRSCSAGPSARSSWTLPSDRWLFGVASGRGGIWSPQKVDQSRLFRPVSAQIPRKLDQWRLFRIGVKARRLRARPGP